jgi:TetR/AcrR family transcriptional regulator
LARRDRRSHPRAITDLPEYLSGTPVGRGRLSPKVRATHQRARVVAAAIAVFGERGYNTAGVDDLLEASKTGYGGFYSLFDGKERCFLASFDAVASSLRAEAVAAGAYGPVP